MENMNKQIYGFVAKKIQEICNYPENMCKAELANLRHGVGHIPGEIPEIWGSFLLDMPEYMYGYRGEPSNAEWAVYTVLTLFALHQQGKNPKTENMNEKGQYLGRAVSKLIHAEGDKDRIWKRFNTVASSTDMAELSHYLRGMIQLLRSENITLDYPDLAVDLYFYQNFDQRNRVKLKWGQDFYRKTSKNEYKEIENEKK